MTPRRRVAAAVVASLLVLLTASPATAAGVGGIEVRPNDGTAFRVEPREGQTVTETFQLENISAQTATVAVYGAAASQSGDSFSVGSAGSASWMELPRQEVTLEPGEERELTFTAAGTGRPETAAVVVEMAAGEVVQRAATIVYAEPGRAVPLPLLAVVIAVALVVAGTVALTVVARRREPAAGPARELVDPAGHGHGEGPVPGGTGPS